MYRSGFRIHPFVIFLIGILGGLYWFSTAPKQASSTTAIINEPIPTPTPIVASTIESIASGLTPTLATPDEAFLLVPKLDIGAPIINTYLINGSWDISQLGMNVGHLQGTGWLDQTSNVVLSGHVELSDGRKGIFSRLGELSVGDSINVLWQEQNTHYIVTEIRKTTEDDLSPLNPTTDARLTLITCGNYDLVSDSYLERLIVVAEQYQS